MVGADRRGRHRCGRGGTPRGGVLLGRVRLGPPGGPLRPRNRGASVCREPRAGVRPDRDAQRRPRVREGPRAGDRGPSREGLWDGGRVTGSGVRSRHVVVVGGGITGLVAAYRLAKSSNGVPIDVTLLEASRTLGGKLRTIEVGGARVEAGADSFVVRKPWAVDLCKELGLHAQLVIPGASGAFVWVRGRLVPFPEPSAFGIPTTVGELVRWPGLSLGGRARAALDLWRRRRRRGDEDESLGSLVSRRLGREALRALVAPLLAGLYAGDPDRLSVQAT